jgi:hypothetical protein
MITPLPWKGEQNPAYALLSPQHQSRRQGTFSDAITGGSVTDSLQFESTRYASRQGSRRLKEVDKRCPCNICGRTEGYCKVDVANNLCYCSQTVDSVRVGETVVGKDSAIWARIGGKSDWALFKVHQPLDRSNQPAKRIEQKPRPQQPVTPLLGIKERHEAFSRLLIELELSEADRNNLLRRGFTAEQIAAAGFKSIESKHFLKDCPAHLPGFVKGHYEGQSGFLLPIRTIDGEIVGFQTRSAKGYRWTSIEGNYRLPCDEPPLVFLSGSTSVIYLVEGTGPKPAFINQTTGAMVVGASGARWSGSPLQMAELIKRHPLATFVLLPDAGSIENPRITDNYSQTAALFTEHKRELSFQWWNQLEKGIDPDADETPFWVDGRQILSSDFFSDYFKQSCLEMIAARKQVEPVTPTETSTSASFIPENAVDMSQPTVLIQAGMGEGKTEEIKKTVHSDDRRTLLVTHRRNLSRNGAARIAKLPYVEEGETFDPITGEHRYGLDTRIGDCSCIDSWHENSSLKRTPAELDGSRVVLDEIDQVLQHALTSTTCIGERTDILALLHKGLPRTAQLIGASATLDDITAEWVAAVTGRAVHIHRHVSTGAQWDHSFLQSKSHAIGQIIKAVSSGENILIATSDTGDDEKGSEIGAHNLLGTLRQHCADLNESNSDAFTSASINAGARDSRQKAFMRDPVAVVKDLRLAIYSPVAETGIDINLKGHFDKVFVLSSGRTMSPQAVVQSAARLRDSNAPRFFWVPTASPQQEGHGITDWKELLSTTLKNPSSKASLLEVAQVNALRSFVPADECPHLRAWAKFKVRDELCAKHYRFVVETLLKNFGSERKSASAVTDHDKELAKEVRAFTKEKKDEAAKVVITAPKPDTSEYESASREEKLAGNRRQKIEFRSGKTLDPSNTSIKEVGQLEKAFGPLRLRHLLANPELADVIDAEASKKMSGFEGDTRKLTARARVNHLIAMGAQKILTSGVVLDGGTDEVQELNQYLGEHKKELSLLFGKRAHYYMRPMNAVEWLASLVGLKIELLGRKRSGDETNKQYMLIEQFKDIDVKGIFKHWTAHPEVVTGQKSPKQKPSPRLETVSLLLNKKETQVDKDTPKDTPQLPEPPAQEQLDLPDWML